MLFIGICGASGSGKSTLASALRERLGEERCMILQQDWYYYDHPELTFEERVQLNYDEPAIFDHDLLLEDVRQLTPHELGVRVREDMILCGCSTCNA